MGDGGETGSIVGDAVEVGLSGFGAGVKSTGAGDGAQEMSIVGYSVLVSDVESGVGAAVGVKEQSQPHLSKSN